MTPSFVFLLDNSTVSFFNLLANGSLFFMFLEFIQIHFTCSDIYISCLFNYFCNRFNHTDMLRLSNVVKQNMRVPQNKQFFLIYYIWVSKGSNITWKNQSVVCQFSQTCEILKEGESTTWHFWKWIPQLV